MKQEVIYKKKITQCRECPNCKILPMLDIDGIPSKNEEFATCSNIEKIIEQALWYNEEIDIPNWCPLKNK